MIRTGKGYPCPYCDSDTRCIDSRRSRSVVFGIRRRRECKTCFTRFTTLEMTRTRAEEMSIASGINLGDA